MCERLGADTGTRFSLQAGGFGWVDRVYAPHEVAQLLTRGNDAPDRVEAEATMLRLVADGAATRTPLGDDALWKPA